MKTLTLLAILCAGTIAFAQTPACPAWTTYPDGHKVCNEQRALDYMNEMETEGIYDSAGRKVGVVSGGGGCLTNPDKSVSCYRIAQTKPETGKAAEPATVTPLKVFDMNAGYVPIDVPPISEEYGNLGWDMCDMGCVFVEADKPPFPDTVLHRRTRLTCAEKARFLMTAEDGSKHCVALLPDPKKK